MSKKRDAAFQDKMDHISAEMERDEQQQAMTDHAQRAEHITGPCRCHEGYKCRQKIDPDCTYHGYAEDIAQALTQAHAAGRREGLEEALTDAESRYVSRDYNPLLGDHIDWCRAKAKEAGHE